MSTQANNDNRDGEIDSCKDPKEIEKHQYVSLGLVKVNGR